MKTIRGGVALLFGVGCAGTPPAVPGDDGWTSVALGSAKPETMRDAPVPVLVPEAERTPLLEPEAWAALRALPGRGPSEHLGGRFERTVRINEAAAGYPTLVAGAALADGALVIQCHHRGGSDAVQSAYAMRKRGGVWEYFVLDASLRIAAREGLDACQRCHLDAPHDSLFGPPQ